MDDAKLKVLRLLRLPPPLLGTLTRDPTEASLTVAWMGQVRADTLRERMEREGRRSALGVRPTGWSYRPGEIRCSTVLCRVPTAGYVLRLYYVQLGKCIPTC